MKRLTIFLLVAVLAMPACAQFKTNRQRSRYNHNDTERYYGLRLGLNVATLNSDMADFDMDTRSGIAFGGVYGFQLANATPIWLEAGLLYAEKGGKREVDGEKVTCRLTYLQVPVVCKYSFDIADDLYLQPYIGGFFALGIAGNTKNYATKKSHSSYDAVNRPDAGLRIGCGLEYQMLYAELGFDFGLANISKDDFESVRTQNFYINIGVNF